MLAATSTERRYAPFLGVYRYEAFAASDDRARPSTNSRSLPRRSLRAARLTSEQRAVPPLGFEPRLKRF